MNELTVRRNLHQPATRRHAQRQALALRAKTFSVVLKAPRQTDWEYMQGWKADVRRQILLAMNEACYDPISAASTAKWCVMAPSEFEQVEMLRDIVAGVLCVEPPGYLNREAYVRGRVQMRRGKVINNGLFTLIVTEMPGGLQGVPCE